MKNMIKPVLFFAVAQLIGCWENTPQERALFHAIEEKNNSKIESLLKNGVNPNCDHDLGKRLGQKPILGFTALEWAISEKNYSAVKLLIVYGANAGVTDSHGTTPLMSLCFSGMDALVKLLLEKGIDIQTEEETKSPLCYAIRGGNIDILKELVDYGFNINFEDDDGSTPLMIAAASGEKEMLDYLLIKGAFLNYKSVMGKTAKTFALGRGNRDLAVYLENKGILSSKLDKDFELFCIIKETCPDFSVNQYPKAWNLAIKNDIEETPLLYAAILGNSGFVKYAITYGIDLDEQDAYGCSVLMNALISNKSNSDSKKNIAFQLISGGANINLLDDDGQNALFMSIASGDALTSEQLIDHGINISMQDKDGVSPLYVALVFQKYDTFKKLLKHGATLDNKVINSRVLLPFVLKNKDFELLYVLLKEGADIHFKSDSGNTLLHFAAAFGNTKVVKYLLSNNLRVDEKNSVGETPIDYAKKAGNEEIMTILIEVSP